MRFLGLKSIENINVAQQPAESAKYVLIIAYSRPGSPQSAELKDGQNIQRNTVPIMEKTSEWYSAPKQQFN